MSNSYDKKILYIKGENNTEVQTHDVMLKDILTIECADANIENQIKVLKVLKFPEKGQHRKVISVLKIIKTIHEKYPGLQIENLGPTDFIVTYEKPEKKSKCMEYLKVGFVSVIVFFGSAFSIMSFNNDISVTRMFGQIYQLVTGTTSDGFGTLEISYSIGIAIGILIFFNHFGKKRFSVDPTPMEVEMRLYENDIQTTLVDIYSRHGEEIDVDS